VPASLSQYRLNYLLLSELSGHKKTKRNNKIKTRDKSGKQNSSNKRTNVQSKTPAQNPDTDRKQLALFSQPRNPHMQTNFLPTPKRHRTPVVLNLFHCWDPLNATDVVWDPHVKIEKVCAPE